MSDACQIKTSDVNWAKHRRGAESFGDNHLLFVISDKGELA
jgi:hypothetical protein